MVIGAFPAAKLGVLAIKQIAKPIANVIKNRAKAHPVFSKYVCKPPAQFYNWMEVKTKMWALNLGKPVHVPPLSEAMAIELGANLLGEFIIFSIGAAMLIFEYNRQATKEAKKQEAERLEKAELSTTITELNFRLERQDTQIRELTRVLADLDSRWPLFHWNRERIRLYEPFDPSNPDQTSTQRHRSTDGADYAADSNVLFRALHFLETHIFVDSTTKDAPVTSALEQTLGAALEEPQTEVGRTIKSAQRAAAK